MFSPRLTAEEAIARLRALVVKLKGQFLDCYRSEAGMGDRVAGIRVVRHKGDGSTEVVQEWHDESS